MPGIKLTRGGRTCRVAKPKKSGIPPTARRTRSATTAARRASLVSPPTPRATPPPAAAQPTTTTTTTSSASTNTRCSDTINSSYTTSIPATAPQAQPQQQQQKAEDGRQPTVNWDCVSYVVSDQQVSTSYEKPEMAAPLLDTRTGKTTTRVASYGKMVTKTVTRTVTTTIATTEILRPGEDGYEESLRRQQRQQEQTPEERDHQHRQYRESRQWASGDRALHENFHRRHHRSAQPAPAST